MHTVKSLCGATLIWTFFWGLPGLVMYSQGELGQLAGLAAWAVGAMYMSGCMSEA